MSRATRFVVKDNRFLLRLKIWSMTLLNTGTQQTLGIYSYFRNYRASAGKISVKDKRGKSRFRQLMSLERETTMWENNIVLKLEKPI